MANGFGDIGRDIRDAVLDAVNSGDFSQLNSRISRSVGNAIDEVNERLGCAGAGKADRWEQSAHASAESGAEQPRAAYARSAGRTNTQLQPYAKRPRGTYSGPLCTVFGAIALGIFAVSFLATFVTFAALEMPARFHILSGSFLLLAAGGGVLLGIGRRLSARVRRFRSYIRTIGGKSYCAISALAGSVRKPEKYVSSDLERMIRMGFFPEGHLDAEKKTLLLTDAQYREYQELMHQRAEAAARTAETDAERLYRETTEKGEYYLRVIRRANDAIPGEVVSEKLYRLEEIVRKIFEQVRQHPEQIPELRRFLDYYMPTTLKLVETYEELDGNASSGENVTKAKLEIEKTLDTINQAFENLYDSLFANCAVDISSDISVLKTMLQQEGLTGKDFTPEK